jgi:hypothetical protein
MKQFRGKGRRVSVASKLCKKNFFVALWHGHTFNGLKWAEMASISTLFLFYGDVQKLAEKRNHV